MNCEYKIVFCGETASLSKPNIRRSILRAIDIILTKSQNMVLDFFFYRAL